jgi:hypothetical protein
MRILICNLDYPGFLSWLYEGNAGLTAKTYQEQLDVRVESLFNVADFYSRNLKELGHEAWDLHINNEVLQRTWAAERAVVSNSTNPAPAVRMLIEKTRRLRAAPLLRQFKPWLQPLARRLNGQHAMLGILAAQIRHHKPDVILNQAVEWVPDEFLIEFKRDVPLIVGQIASPLSPSKRLAAYDLMISSLPNFVDRFRRQGLRAEYIRLAFEDSILGKLPERKPSIDVSFVGTLSTDHVERHRLLEAVADRLDLAVWGRLDSRLPAGSPMRRCHRGDAWGKDMYAVLRNSKITLNYHIGLADHYANNLRLFEATGVGAMLLTDEKHNLHEMFEPGKEVVVYRTPEECADMARYYLVHDEEREAIARAGQQRTLRDHTYRLRMKELASLFERCLRTNVGASRHIC